MYYPGPDDGQKMAVDSHEVMAGPDRYTLRDGKLTPVTATANVAAHKAHSASCPFNDRGQRR